MENFVQSSRTAFKGAMGGSESIREEASYEDDACSERAGLEILARTVLLELDEVADDSTDKQQSLILGSGSPNHQQRKSKRRNRLSIEIKDTSEKCVQLEKQLVAVQRAVVEPLQRELVLLKAACLCNETQTSDPELEIVLMASFESDCGSSWSSSSRSSTSMDDEDSDSYDEEYEYEYERRQRNPKHLVNQRLRYQIEGELLAMRDSLERNQEWRAFYAYHLERFRQMHKKLTDQYHKKLMQTDRERYYAEEELSRAQRDTDANRQIVVKCSEEVMQSIREKHHLGRDFLAYKTVSERKLKEVKVERDNIASKLQGDLTTCIQEIEVLKTNTRNLETLKNEAGASKRLGEVLNEKLHQKTKKVTSLFAENLKLREQGMLVRQDLINTKEVNAKQAKQLEESARAMKLVKSDMTNGGINGELMAQNSSMISQLQVLRSKVAVQDEGLRETRKDAVFWKDEAASLQKTNKIDRGICDTLCDTLKSTVSELMDEKNAFEKEVLELRRAIEPLRQEVESLTVGMEMEQERTEELSSSLEAQLGVARILIQEQHNDLHTYETEIIALAEQLSTIQVDMQSEKNLNETLTARLQEVLALKKEQGEELIQAELENGDLRNQVEEFKSEIKAKETKSEEMNLQLVSKLEEVNTHTTLQAKDSKNQVEENEALKLEISDLKFALQKDRENAGDEILNLHFEIEGLRMDTSLLDYEVSQLKSHLDSVMEENVYLGEGMHSHTGRLEVAERRNGDLNEQVSQLMLRLPHPSQLSLVGIESETGIDKSILASFRDIVAPTLSNCMDIPVLSEDKLKERIHTQFEHLDATIRDNDALLLEVSRSGVSGSPDQKEKSAMQFTNDTAEQFFLAEEEQALAPSDMLPMYTSDTAPLSGLLIETTDEDDTEDDLSASSGGSSVAPRINGKKSRSCGIATNPVAPVSSTKSVTSAAGCDNDDMDSFNLAKDYPFVRSAAYEEVASDELLALKQLARQLATPIAKSSMLLADHLVDVMHFKEGSDDAVLEQMDALRELLLVDEPSSKDAPTSSTSYDDESSNPSAYIDCDPTLGELSTEVTEADFRALELFHRLLQNGNDVLIDETADPSVEDVFEECQSLDDTNELIKGATILKECLSGDDEKTSGSSSDQTEMTTTSSTQDEVDFDHMAMLQDELALASSSVSMLDDEGCAIQVPTAMARTS